ncbi:pyridoxal phosphate-dependent transferase [Pisolithus tinctorius]|nr:pyridoxal phosphate-dependent transferase [Pisolithus tinctorius]
MSLSMRNILDDATHDALDRQVNSLIPTLLNLNADLPLDFPYCILLLQVIVQLSGGSLDIKYDSFLPAFTLLTSKPELVDMLRAAWESRSYRDIRNLGITVAVMAALVPIGNDPLGWPLRTALRAITVSLPTWSDNLGYLRPLLAQWRRFTLSFFHRLKHSKARTHAKRGLVFPVNVAFCAQPNTLLSIGRHLFTIKPSDLRIVHHAIDPMGDPLLTSQETLEHCLSILGIPGIPEVEISEFFHVCGKTDLTPKSLDVSQIPLATGADVKDALRQQIANFLVRDESPASTRTNISKDDVFLFPCGMPALWNVPFWENRCIWLSVHRHKIVEKSAIFYGHGRDCDIDDLVDAMLARKGTENASVPPILALYTECSSKPLLFTVNIPRLGALADKYDFLVVIDETVGTFANVGVLPYTDISVTSLSKYLDGYATVLGGSSYSRSLIIDPRMRRRAMLKVHLVSTFEDTYFTPAATITERNSCDSFERTHIINANTGYICEFLCVHSIEDGASEGKGAVIKQVWYPKYITPGNYQICRRHLPTGKLDHKIRGYGGLFSLTFTSLDTSRAFYDVLEVAKGESIVRVCTHPTIEERRVPSEETQDLRRTRPNGTPLVAMYLSYDENRWYNVPDSFSRQVHLGGNLNSILNVLGDVQYGESLAHVNQTDDLPRK